MLNRMVLVLVLLGCVSCGDAGGGGGYDVPSEEEYDDTAEALSSLVVEGNGGDLDAMGHVSVMVMGGALPRGIEVQADGSLGGSIGGFQYTYVLECQGSDGRVLSECGSETHEAVSRVSWGGSLTTPQFQGELSRDGQWMISGFGSDALVFHGAGSFDVQSTVTSVLRGDTRYYAFSYDALYSDVYVDVHSGVVQSGTFEFTIESERRVSAESSRSEARFFIRAELVVLDEGVARLVLDGVRTYELDLQTGRLKVVVAS